MEEMGPDNEHGLWGQKYKGNILSRSGSPNRDQEMRDRLVYWGTL